MTHRHEDKHDHRHGAHDHVHAPARYDLAFGAGIALNFGFVVVEAVYGFAANSLALLSDAGHNLGDVLALAVAWGAMRLSRSAPTRHRTYGMRRTSILAALFNALALLLVIGGIGWEAIGRFFSPEEVSGATMIWVASIGVVINTATALFFLKGRGGDVNIRGAYLHMIGDAGVSLGVVLSGLAIRATGWHWLDPAVSLAICAVIVVGTWGLLEESVSLALDAVPSSIDPGAVRNYLGSLPGVAGVHDLHIWAMSTTEVALTVHLVMPELPQTDRFLGDLCHALQHDHGIGHVTVQIERGEPGVVCRQEPDHVV
jgi:cobalt-zinc-cadmium efflux system protein